MCNICPHYLNVLLATNTLAQLYDVKFSSGLGVDPCSQSGVCENGVCVRTRSSFTCQCRRGYTLTSDKRTCKGTGFESYLLDVILTVI